MMSMGHDDPEMQMLWSPMSRDGQEKFARLRAAIHTAFGPQSRAPPTPAQALRAKYARAARRSGDEIFFEAFGSPDALLREREDDAMCAELFARSGGVDHHQLRRRATATTATVYQPESEPPSAYTASVQHSDVVGAAATTSAFSKYGAAANGVAAAATASSSLGFNTAAAPHVSQLIKPTRLKTPKRISLKRARVGECSAEKELPLRKPRITLSDTTNLMPASTSTTTMTNPWDRHGLKQPPAPTATSSTAAMVPKPFGVSRFGAMRAPMLLHRAPPSVEIAPTTMTTSTRVFALR